MKAYVIVVIELKQENEFKLTRKELEESKQAELTQDADKDKALDNIVDNLDNKLSENEEKILEVFKENE